MSELTTCNFCSYERYRTRARARGAAVTLAVDEDLGMLAVRESDREKPLAWFLELSDRCVC